MAEPIQIGILLYPNVTQLDATGPAQVLSRVPGAKMHMIWKTLAPVPTDAGFSIVPTTTFADCPKPDILVIPGGGTGGVVRDEETMKWIKDAGAKAERVVSVCTGAFILQAAGFLDGQKATTHWSAIEVLRKQAPNTTVVENVRYVDNGHVVTSAGVSAGIDMTLHVVAKLLGFDAAEKAALNMEYEWKPREEYPKG